jgi:hypothetical protein
MCLTTQECNLRSPTRPDRIKRKAGGKACEHTAANRPAPSHTAWFIFFLHQRGARSKHRTNKSDNRATQMNQTEFISGGACWPLRGAAAGACTSTKKTAPPCAVLSARTLPHPAGAHPQRNPPPAPNRPLSETEDMPTSNAKPFPPGSPRGTHRGRFARN